MPDVSEGKRNELRTVGQRRSRERFRERLSAAV
jgi:hypothetical protein